MRSDRYAILLIILAVAACFKLAAQPPPLVVERRGDTLRVTAPRLHFLEGRPLEQLHNGAAVAYEFELSLMAESRSKPVFHRHERFIVSFDLWEEKFSVLQAGPAARTGSHLTAALAEAWCFESLTVPLPPPSSGGSFVIKLSCRLANGDSQGGMESGSGLTLAGLIDMFSRKERETPLRWDAASAPFRPAELKDSGKTRNTPDGRRIRHGGWESVPEVRAGAAAPDRQRLK